MENKIVFGAYETYAFSDRKKPMVWQVQQIIGDEILVAATEVLEERPYNSLYHIGGWAHSELRIWLAEDFMREAFTLEEFDAIIYKKYNSEKSMDWVTIPSVTEIVPDAYKKSLRNALRDSKFHGCWLRDGGDEIRVAYVMPDAVPYETGKGRQGMIPDEKLSVLPMMWLDKTKLKEIEVYDSIDHPEQGVLLDNSFYMNGTYVRAYKEDETHFYYIKTLSGKAVLVGNDALDDKDSLIFPGEIDGLKVNGILGEYRSKSVKSIVVEEGIEFIGEESIVLFDKLEKVQLPSTLKSLSGSNFAGCRSLSEIQIPIENEYMLRDRAIIYSKDKKRLLKKVPVSFEIGLSVPDTVEEMEPGAFCDACLWELEIPKSMTEIAPYVLAFADVKKVFLPQSLEVIDAHGFENSQIQKIEIPESVDEIGDSAFACCKKLHKITLPKRVLRFGENVFKDCRILSNVKLPEGISPLGKIFADSLHREYEEHVYRSDFQDYMTAKKGNRVTFGYYMQRMTEETKDPIEWIVLKKEDNRLLVLSDKALFETEAYNMSLKLEEFQQEAFIDVEKECIDAIFCLNKEEVEELLPWKKKRMADRTDLNYLNYGYYQKATWWLDSQEKDESDKLYIQIVDRKGEFSALAEHDICSVRPAMWIDLDKVSKLMRQNNQEYIREWMLEHNEYLAFREDCEEFIELLTLFVVIFEKLAGINQEDIIMRTDGKVQIISGPAIKSEEALYLLKLMNYDYAYLQFEEVKQVGGYRYLKYLEGIFTDEILDHYFGEWYQDKIRQYKNCKFDRIIYVVNKKVFYADQPLTEAEIAYISRIKDSDQTQYDIDHNEDGSMCCW